MAEHAPRIGLALSGGGFRATAFGLGCLRALEDRDLLGKVSVVSGISGGSLLAAMWAYGPASFDDFEESVTQLLRSGLQLELARRTFSPLASSRNMVSVGRAVLTGSPRTRSRTESLVRALADRGFGDRALADVTHPGLATVISATDMVSSNAVRFGSAVSSCAPYGQIISPVTVAEAVAASAAFPVLLPALTRKFDFRESKGTEASRTLVMTDGGVYDNLGLSPLLPGRSKLYTSHVYDLDYLIAVDAGRGRSERPAARFMPRRLMQSFDITYSKTQDAGRTRLHLAGESSKVKGFIHAYLGMRDENLPVPLEDFVPKSRVVAYPTDFAAMKSDDLFALSIRGEQLIRTLLAYYVPDLH